MDRRLDTLEARALLNTESRLTAAEPVQQPFWSPDSRYVAFFIDGSPRKLDLGSGNVQTVATMPGSNYGGTWNLDGTILFGSSLTKGLQRVSANGGVPAPVTTLDASANEQAHLWPQFLPDGRHFLYFALGSEDRAIYVGDLQSPERTLVLRSEYMAYFAAPGDLFFVRDGALMVQRFDADARELQGEPVQVAPGVQAAIANGRVGMTVSESGVLVYRPASGSAEADSQLVWLDRSGKQLGTVGTSGLYRGIEISPDDGRVAVHREEPQNGTGDLWIVDVQRGPTSRFTLDSTQHSMSPVWSPDGGRILFSRQVGASWTLHEKNSAGVGGENLLLETKNFAALTPLGVSPDGATLVFRISADGPGDFSVLPLSGERKPSPYLHTPFNQTSGQLSPDGRWLAYTSNESGRAEIYVQSFPSPGTKYAVSTSGGTQPRWRRDGRELFYLSPAPGLGTVGPNRMMRVSVDATGPGLRFGIPERLFDSYAYVPAHGAPTYQYAVTSDGQRFLVVRQIAAADTNPAQMPLTVVLNWKALLNTR